MKSKKGTCRSRHTYPLHSSLLFPTLTKAKNAAAALLHALNDRMRIRRIGKENGRPPSDRGKCLLINEFNMQ